MSKPKPVKAFVIDVQWLSADKCYQITLVAKGVVYVRYFYQVDAPVVNQELEIYI
jgi:hypothetical protein